MVATHCAVMCGLFVHALRCALLLVSLVFGELFFGESPSLHYLFLHFLANYIGKEQWAYHSFSPILYRRKRVCKYIQNTFY